MVIYLSQEKQHDCEENEDSFVLSGMSLEKKRVKKIQKSLIHQQLNVA